MEAAWMMELKGNSPAGQDEKKERRMARREDEE
jgi:hypothetical protein